jgi:methylphosphotriester-DNA--protein-cysteine methyltransferase
MMTGTAYREIRPSTGLRSFVDRLWIRRDRLRIGTVAVNRVLPDGCMDVIFNLGDPPLKDGEPDRSTSYVVGAMTRPLCVGLTGDVDMIAVRFRPGAAAALLGIPADQLADGTVELEACWGRTARDLECQIMETAGTTGRADLLERALLRRAEAAAAPSAAITWAVRRILETRGRVKVAELADRVGLGERQLRRRFRSSVGLSPKTACRVARFQGLLGQIRQTPAPNWGRLAWSAGYHDQAHLIREFRAFTGLTPTVYLAACRGDRFVQDGAGPGD